MSLGHGKDTKIYAEGYNLTGYFRSGSLSSSADVAETSTFGDADKEYIAGLKDETVSLEGVYDPATGAVDEQLSTALAKDPSLWLIFPQLDTLGNVGFGVSAVETAYEVNADLGDAVMVSAELQSKVGVERLKAHHALAAETATGNAASIDNTASSASGGFGYVMCSAASGTTPTLTVKIQHSTDNSVWADLITFAQITAANAKERLTVAGTVNRYTRATHTIGGTTPSFTYVAAFGRE